MLRGPPRRRLSMGGAAQAGDASQDRRGAVGGDSRDGARRSSFPGMCEAVQPEICRCLRTSPDEVLLVTGCRWSGWRMCSGPMRIACWHWPIICPARQPRRCSTWPPAEWPSCRRRPVAGVGPFDHPDAQRRFRVMNNVEELERALDYPWEKWTHLPPSGAAAVGGTRLQRPGAGFRVGGHGQDHRGAAPGGLSRPHQPRCRVLLTTFSDILANALRAKLRRLISNEPRLGERIEVHRHACHRRAALRAAFRPPQSRLARDDQRMAGGRGRRCSRSQVQPEFPAHRVGGDG